MGTIMGPWGVGGGGPPDRAPAGLVASCDTDTDIGIFLIIMNIDIDIDIWIEICMTARKYDSQHRIGNIFQLMSQPPPHAPLSLIK